MRSYTTRVAVWIVLYLLFILAPLFALLAGSLPPARDFWTEFSVAIGYAGLAMMGLQFGLTARFRYVTEPWGEDVIYHFHRQISLIAVALVIAHPIILFIVRPELLVLFYIRIIKPLFLLRRPYRIAEVRKERGDTATLVMQPEGHPGFRFTPGQFGWLTVWGSPFKITGHPFSFSSSAALTDGRVEMTIRNLGDFTSTIHTLPAGKRVYLDGPYGAFTVGNPADMHVLIAGGIGITPMMSIIRTFADNGDKRPVILLYGSKDWESITFREELDALKERLNLTIVHVIRNPPAEWTGERGHITAEVFKRHLLPPYADHEYFICGADIMMDSIEKALDELHVPISKYHSERYSFV